MLVHATATKDTKVAKKKLEIQDFVPFVLKGMFQNEPRPYMR